MHDIYLISLFPMQDSQKYMYMYPYQPYGWGRVFKSEMFKKSTMYETKLEFPGGRGGGSN